MLGLFWCLLGVPAQRCILRIRSNIRKLQAGVDCAVEGEIGMEPNLSILCLTLQFAAWGAFVLSPAHIPSGPQGSVELPTAVVMLCVWPRVQKARDRLDLHVPGA